MAVSIKINNIKEEEFKFSDDNIEVIEEENLSIGINLGFRIDKEKNFFTVRFTISYAYKDKSSETSKEIMKFTTLTRFELSDINEILKVIEKEDSDEEVFDIPDNLIYTFVGTAISSTRGMLVYKLAGTKLSSFYIPMIDVQNLMKDRNHRNIESA
tara:strand:- start:479 stop:946 length:468 start_codon:yes stop_codon:yes gene_type:complete